jgi:hypothetical protein
LLVRDENVSPILFTTNQPGADRVLANVGELLGQTFVMSKPVIEEIPMPFYACDLSRNSFVITN